MSSGHHLHCCCFSSPTFPAILTVVCGSEVLVHHDEKTVVVLWTGHHVPHGQEWGYSYEQSDTLANTQANTRNMQECLAEAMLEIDELPDSAINLGDWEDIDNGQDFSYFKPFGSKEDDSELESVPAAFSKGLWLVIIKITGHACNATTTPIKLDRGRFQCWWINYELCVPIAQRLDEPANSALIQAGLLSSTPLQPMVTVKLECLELYHQLCRCQLSLSIQAIMKTLCILQNISYTQHLRVQFAAAFDAYLDIK
ncbi:hypothetical protein BDN67DRAFT_984053 [Paxillus ammoniavirescens]|nr:hypothetical protein BDN67DRAFT_984053 [Paxillus ammoniavirescens]